MSEFQIFGFLSIGALVGFVTGVFFTIGTSQFQERLTRICANKATLKAAQDAVEALKKSMAKDPA